MKFFEWILIAFGIFFAFKANLYLGIIVTVAAVLYAAVKFLPFLYKIRSRKVFAEGNYAQAKTLYKKAMKYSKNVFDTRMEYVYMLLRTGDFEEAQQIMDTLLSYNLEPAKRNLAILQRCMCYYKNGNLDDAYNDCLELYNDDYRSITMYGLLGYLKILKAPHSDETFDFCAEAYEYADDDRDICDNMLICYYNQGNYIKAKEISDAVIEKNPKFIEAWYHAALIDTALNDYKSAKEKLDNIKNCNRSEMTTISEDEIQRLIDEVNSELREND